MQHAVARAGRPLEGFPSARARPALRLHRRGRPHRLAVLVALALPALASGAVPPPPRFEVDVLPILHSNCTRCHGATVHKGGLDLSSAAGVFRGSSSGVVVTPHKPAESLLYTVLHEGRMPPKKETRRPSAEQIALIRRWIEAGAPAGTVEGARAREPREHPYHAALAILRLRCTVCHGPRRQEGGLSLASKADMLKGGKSGPAIRPGHAAESPLVRKVRAGVMPPPERLILVGLSPMPAAELAQIAHWIDLGAPEAPLVEDVATTTPDPLVTDEDRKFWAFRSPRRPPVPTPTLPSPRGGGGLGGGGQVRNPIDAFLLARLEEKGLGLSPEADKVTLLRRATFDLTGLPPSPAEVRVFLADTAPDAYERLIDRLLASPRYGERWGRHWLDLAGYADSESKQNYDYLRPHAWRYRDYVIRAFNADKPYDRFLTEQLAGDELVDYQKAPVITQETVDTLAATGFLRMTPDSTDVYIEDTVSRRLDVIADEIDVFSSVVLGLTLKCARCHDHKFDPIPQRDYYRLMAVFRGAFDEHDWMKPLTERVLAIATEEEKKRVREHNEPLYRQNAALNAEIERRAEPLKRRYFEQRLAALPEAIRADVRKALAAPAGKRDAVQRYLAGKFEKHLRMDTATLKMLEPGFKKDVEPIEKEMATVQVRFWPTPAIQALWDRGQPTPTQIYRRGDPLNRGGYVGPGVPSVLTDGKTPFRVLPPRVGAKSTGRRLALARWLARPDHPLTARVLVNRVCRHHFGRGIVDTLDNFGHTGARPSHPELLDWLATEFVAPASGGVHLRRWSLKRLHRLMMTSAAYRQSSTVFPEAKRLDPENRLWSRMPLRRMEAEVVRDTLLLASGRLNATPYGPADRVEAHDDGLVTEPPTDQGGWRRSLYVRQQRTTIPTILEAFDLPQMCPNCADRRDSCVAPQALHLKNDAWVRQLADDFARRVRSEAGADLARQVERVYLLALGRPPTAREREVGTRALKGLTDAWQEAAPGGKPGEDAQLRALTSYVHMVLNSAAFLFID